MRTEERQQEDRVRRTQALNIIQAKVEKSLFSVAIGQISVNLTLTIHRSGCREAPERVWVTPAGWAGRLTAMLSVLAALALVQPLHSSAAEATLSPGAPADLLKPFGLLCVAGSTGRERRSGAVTVADEVSS